MTNTAASDFVKEFNACFSKAKKEQVPLSVMIATFEVAKQDLIGQFLSARAIKNFQTLAKDSTNPPLDGQHKHD